MELALSIDAPLSDVFCHLPSANAWIDGNNKAARAAVAYEV